MTLRTKIFAAGIALWGGLSLPGCAGEQESLIVLHSPAWDEEGSCLADPSTDTRLSQGVLDVSAHTPYLLPVILQNQLVADDTNGVDNGEMQLRNVDVRLTMDQAPDIIDALELRDPALVDFNYPLATDSLPSEGQAGVLVEVISRTAAEELEFQLNSLEDGARPVLTAHLVFHARRTGNAVGGIGDVEAREFSFPIQICAGCLLTCSTCAGGECPIEPTGVVGGVCGNAQDLFYAPSGCANPLMPDG